MTKKEPKSDDCLSKFDWHDLFPISLAIMFLHNLKIFQKPNQTQVTGFWVSGKKCVHQKL